ncbi:hypothetical protein DY000_02055325 [Brassica cretica]|uniref:Secreted protein n=1 Tax=Brassica cretica TaxID=69181 RepID=A0ABQ7A6M0_BRACR|nr:hypothetical protein DY000_02055325 [Brassica cretica]
MLRVEYLRTTAGGLVAVAMALPLRRRILSSSALSSAISFAASVPRVTTISPDSRDARLSVIVF